MREIKFRAWDKTQKVMMPVSEINFGDEALALTVCFYGAKTEKYPKQLVNGENGILMQFTGLKDKNGKEIYEGDVVKTHTEKNMVIGWSKRFASFVIERSGWAFSHYFGESLDPEDCEVLGNIYENPDLVNP